MAPWAVAHQDPLSTEFSKQEYWSALPLPTPGDLPDPGIEPTPLAWPASAGRFSATSTHWEANLSIAVVQPASHAQLFVTQETAARQASLSLTISQSLSESMSIEAVMPSNHLIPCCPLLLLPSIFPSIRVF